MKRLTLDQRIKMFKKAWFSVYQAEVIGLCCFVLTHYGSTTDSTFKFIKAVPPRFAAISIASSSQYHLPSYRVIRRYRTIRVGESEKIKKILRSNYREKDSEHRRFGDDHIIFGTNGELDDLECDYI